VLKTFSGRVPSQNEYELRSFIQLLVSSAVRKYCEIGSREGDTFFEVMKHLPPNARGVACDLPGGLWGKKTTGRQLEQAVTALRNDFKQVHMIIGDSTKAEIIHAIFECGPYDAILIDGDHTYEGVKADWENYRHMGRIIAFHDIVGIDQTEKVHGRAVEVPRLWQEIKDSGAFDTVEFIAPNSRMGIGCVLK
jgi:hypothetical protein